LVAEVRLWVEVVVVVAAIAILMAAKVEGMKLVAKVVARVVVVVKLSVVVEAEAAENLGVAQVEAAETVVVVEGRNLAAEVEDVEDVELFVAPVDLP
jgi:hypothetical protein